MRKFYINTKLSCTEVQDVVQQAIEPTKKFRLKHLFSETSKHLFSGSVGNAIFEIKPIISYRNSFIPIIKGSIEPYLNGSRIHVKMKLQEGVAAFMCIWLGITMFSTLWLIVENVFDGFNGHFFVPMGMSLFGYGLMTISFKLESSDNKQQLLSILEGEIEN